jgi:hypothetical protein
MDDISSNINITCDMLVHIIKNLIVLSNTSTNVSSDAIKSLLSEISLDHQHSSSSTSTTTLTNSSNAASRNANNSNYGFKSILDETDLHLYHPLYLNNQLNQYNKINNPTSTPMMATPTSSDVHQHLPHSTDNNNHSK